MNSFRRITPLLTAGLSVICFGAGCATSAAHTDYRAVVQSPDRSDADRKTDERRKPEQLLAFIGVRHGMKVLDIGAGGGYSTELLARVVGPKGVVYAHNANQRDALDERMKNPAMKNVVVSIRPFDDPAPPEAKGLDLITVFLIYHDTTYLEAVDRVKMNKRFFELLRPGGHLVVVDHSAKPGAGVDVGKSLHRIEQSALRREVETAGFKFDVEGDFLRNPDDPRDKPFFDMSIPTDKFVLRFVRP